jgi:hypothetical protein
MAAYQLVRREAGTETMADFMARRLREIELQNQDADSLGREVWSASTKTGQNIAAARPSDVLSLGVRSLERRAAASSLIGRTAAAMTSVANDASLGGSDTERPQPGRIISYGALQAQNPSPEALADLRRKQAQFGDVTRDVDIKNSWFALPALAPAAVILGLEGAGAVASRLAGDVLKLDPFQFVKRDPYIRVGDNWATRAGRRAHDALRDRLAQKPGWVYEPTVKTPEGQPLKLKPDVGAPARNPVAPDRRRLMELKPNTPTGRRAGQKAAERYQQETGNKTRPIYYNPKDYM